MRHLLIVDDDPLNRQTLRFQLAQTKEANACIHEASSVNEALTILKSEPIDIILLDVHLPDLPGHSAIPQFRALNPDVEVIVISSSHETHDVLASLRAGAMSYLTRPLKDRELLNLYLDAAMERRTLRVRSQVGSALWSAENADSGLIGTSRPMQRLREQLAQVAQANVTVLLIGETGTGKGVCATAINEMRRKHFKQNQRPYLNLNIAGISDSLAEAELFGHEKGAYTDARSSMPGFFELADQGDIFLDEIGDASLPMQAKLLKVLQEKMFYRIGGRSPIHSQFALICATNKNLEELSRENLFRRDLLTRISTFVINVPALRDHREDIPELISYLSPKISRKLNRSHAVNPITPELMNELQNYSFPGNIRELEAILERAHLFASPAGRLQLKDLVSENMSPSLPARAHALTMDELMQRPFDLLSHQEFPGLESVSRWFESQVLQEARTKFSTQTEMAHALKLSKATISLRMRHLS